MPLPARRPGTPRTVRWMELVAAAQWAYSRAREIWETLDAREREEAWRLLEKSRGRPGNLTQAEQRRLRDLAVKAFRNL